MRVTERSPYTFVRDNYAVFDFIYSSHNAEECLNYLKDFSYEFNKENIMTGGVKSSFVKHIYKVLGAELSDTVEKISVEYDEKFKEWIKDRVKLLEEQS